MYLGPKVSAKGLAAGCYCRIPSDLSQSHSKLAALFRTPTKELTWVMQKNTRMREALAEPNSPKGVGIGIYRPLVTKICILLLTFTCAFIRNMCMFGWVG